MILSTLDISCFRNIKQLTIDPHHRLNLITGDNGSGKTSVLEAIQCLATGHSFRTRKPKELIASHEQSYRLTASFEDVSTRRQYRAGLERARDGDISLRLNFEDVKNQAEITHLLPVMALTPDSHQLIKEGPELRRQFLNWGLFHVEPSFMEAWRNFKRSLSQRNQLIRERASDKDIEIWNIPLSNAAEIINTARESYVVKLNTQLIKRLEDMEVMFHVELRYRSGWNTDQSLADVLSSNIETHRRMKTTTDGPHRAELVISIDEILAKQVLSRGEQKVLVYALHLAQLDILNEISQRNAIVLCDDLTSELDIFHSKAIINQLVTLEGQTFVTGVDLSVLQALDHERFHMEHGNIERDYNKRLPT